MTVHGLFGLLVYELCIILYYGVYEMGNDNGIRFQKSGTEVGRVGCPWIAHCWVLGLLKSVPSLCELDQKRPCVGCRKLFEMNGLSCMGISRLMHKLDVLT